MYIVMPFLFPTFPSVSINDCGFDLEGLFIIVCTFNIKPGREDDITLLIVMCTCTTCYVYKENT